MSFDASWLALREPADGRARDAGLLQAFREAVPEGARVVDLGSGTGSTWRAVEDPTCCYDWILTDHDEGLLAEAERRTGAATRVVDLARSVEEVVEEAAAVTASALIDLVSAAWLERLASACSGKVIYVALNVDGDDEWRPAHYEDGAVEAAFARDMGRDKGFGPALGSRAGEALREILSEQWVVQTASSPWQLERGRDAALIEALAVGTARAAGASADWLAARRAAESVRIGHVDLLAIPKG